MLSFRGLGKPQYLLRPSQIVRRLVREMRLKPQEDTVRLPWGLELTLDPLDTVSDALLGQGIYDLVTTEVLWRLTARGERTADIGANVGYMSSVLAARAGTNGSVLSFEPHPNTFAILQRNAERWNAGAACARVSAMHGAVSDRDGTAGFVAHPNGEVNASHAFLAQGESPASAEVRVWRFANFLGADETFGVVKVDTQGHERRVFAGMGEALHAGGVRDIVYEEEAGYPAPSHAALENAGYAIFAFAERLSGPRMIAPTQLTAPKRSYEVLPSYLATRDVPRAKALFARPGWHCLHG
jgi:FkbM family methyltransferase